jgi:hypothetical protein
VLPLQAGQPLRVGGQLALFPKPFGGEDQEDQHPGPAARAYFGANLDAEVLGHGVAEDLTDDERRFERDVAAGERLAVEAGGRERLAEGEHAEVGCERSGDGVGDEDRLRGRRQPGSQPTRAEVHGAAVVVPFTWGDQPLSIIKPCGNRGVWAAR